MLTRRRLIVTFALLLPGSILHGRPDQQPPATATTVTLLIEGMT